MTPLPGSRPSTCRVNTDPPAGQGRGGRGLRNGRRWACGRRDRTPAVSGAPPGGGRDPPTSPVSPGHCPAAGTQAPPQPVPDVRRLRQAVEAGGEAEDGDESQRRRASRSGRGGGTPRQLAGLPLPQRARLGPAAPRRRHPRGSSAGTRASHPGRRSPGRSGAGHAGRCSPAAAGPSARSPEGRARPEVGSALTARSPRRVAARDELCRGQGTRFWLPTLPAERPHRAGGERGQWRRRDWRERGLGRRLLATASAAAWDRGLNQLLVPRTPRQGRDGGIREDGTPVHSTAYTALRCPGPHPGSVSVESKEFAPMLNKTKAFQSSGGVYLR